MTMVGGDESTRNSLPVRAPSAATCFLAQKVAKELGVFVLAITCLQVFV